MSATLSATHQPAGNGEGGSDLLPSPQELADAAKFIAMQSLVEQRAAIDAQLKVLYTKRSRVNYHIADLGRTMKLPFHCAAGTVRKSYKNERYGKPRKYVLRATRNGLCSRKRIVVVAA